MIKPQPGSSGTVFTLGYQLRTLENYIEELERAGVEFVIDIRENPWSYKRGFKKNELYMALRTANIRYLHLRVAGNPKELRRSAESHAECLDLYASYIDGRPSVVERLAELLARSVDQGRRICLLCYERHPDDCHRTILLSRCVERIDREIAVKHLGTEGAPRLSIA